MNSDFQFQQTKIAMKEGGTYTFCLLTTVFGRKMS